MITLTTFEEAKDGFRSRELRQSLYDEGAHLMFGVVVNLHGEAHIARRRLENRLFRRDTFAWYERDRLPEIIEQVLRPALAAGGGDLRTLARNTMMSLSIDVAGVDVPADQAGDRPFDRLIALMSRLARASTVAHAVGDKQAIIGDGDHALDEFDHDFYASSLARRADLVARVDRGELDETALPRDVLTTLLRNQDRLDLPPATMLREVAYFPWVGSHSTSAQLVHAMHHMFEWIDDHPSAREQLADDDVLRQRFVHESMRLHPASPVALRVATVDVELKSGRRLPQGSTVVIDIESANRDPAVFGGHADRFDPSRTIADGVPPWGLSFGHGTHACLGQELAGGLEPDDLTGPQPFERHLFGSVALMAGALLRAGAWRDPADAPTQDTATTRAMWDRYPVRFGSPT